MAPKFPDEVNVFLVPHSRMKDLVGSYMDQLSTADFRSQSALENLLPLLEKTFTEFKTHEHIENQYIMERLKQRLKMMNVTSQSVCNCHGDSQLVDILSLLRDGYTCTNKPISERITFGSQLQKVLTEFTEQFIPHMKEEEEIFQPLLMKYFAYEELRLLKEQVIQQHELWKEKLLAQKETAENMLVLLNSVASEVIECCSSSEENYQDTLNTLVELTCENLSKTTSETREPTKSADFNDLPQEMIVNIFSYLNPLDRTRCAQVNKLWNMLVYSPQLWREIYPTNWAKGYFDFKYRDPYSMVESQWKMQSILDDNDDYMDSEEVSTPQAEREIRSYESFTMNALVRIGEGVQRLVVAGGLNLSSTVLRSMLILCPNIQHLDASYTNVTDLSFKGLASKNACVSLEYLDFTGCRFVTDVGLERLGACFKSRVTESTYGSKCGSCCQSCKRCPKSYYNQTKEVCHGSNGSLAEAETFSPGLSFLSLSGCTSVTDFGLRSLLDTTLQTSSLCYMDLSGCSLVSGSMLNRIAECSTRLQPQDLYYCNRIEQGPYPDEANGCQNLECPIRGCCCFDQ